MKNTKLVLMLMLVGSVFSVPKVLAVPLYYVEQVSDICVTYQQYVVNLQQFENHIPEVEQDTFSQVIKSKNFPLYAIHILEDMEFSGDSKLHTFERMAKNRMIATILGDNAYPIRRQASVDSLGNCLIGEAYPFA